MVITAKARLAPFSFPQLPSIDDLVDDFFYSFEKNPKPPIDISLVLGEDREEILGWKIETALAGFKEGDVRVYSEGQKLFIEGDNTKNKLSDKFSSNFCHTFATSNKLDLSAAEVKLENGILRVFIPIKDLESERNYLLGGEK